MKIVSGGQTGVDRAALDVALELGLSCGGWCPRGRKAEDGPIPDRYPLTETTSIDYAQRTEWNVRDSDGTVVFSVEPVLSAGSKETIEFATKYGNPVLHLYRSGESASLGLELLRFIRDNHIKTLNVAGPRASEEPEVAAFVREVLEKASEIE